MSGTGIRMHRQAQSTLVRAHRLKGGHWVVMLTDMGHLRRMTPFFHPARMDLGSYCLPLSR
jgi:hypothetical protein